MTSSEPPNPDQPEPLTPAAQPGPPPPEMAEPASPPSQLAEPAAPPPAMAPPAGPPPSPPPYVASAPPAGPVGMARPGMVTGAGITMIVLGALIVLFGLIALIAGAFVGGAANQINNSTPRSPG